MSDGGQDEELDTEIDKASVVMLAFHDKVVCVLGLNQKNCNKRFFRVF